MKIDTLKKVIYQAGALMATLSVAAMMLLSLPAQPAAADNSQKIYAVSCDQGTVELAPDGHSVGCSISPELAKIEGVGQIQKPVPASASDVQQFTVDCGTSGPNALKVGDTANFACPQGYQPVITSSSSSSTPTQNGGGNAGSGTPCTGANAVSAACANCGSQNIGTNGDCIGTAPDPAACAADPSITGCSSDANANCSRSGCDLIQKYINPIINILSVIFGLIAVASLILGGIQYSMSEGDPQKAQLAKNRIAKTIFATVSYFFLYAMLQFLIPGGIFNK